MTGPTHRQRQVLAIVGVVLVVVATAVVLIGRHRLEDGNDELDRRWAPLRPALDVRYEKLAALEQQFRGEYAVERPFNQRIERLLRRWDRLYGQRDIEQENEVDTANALELSARRLIRYTRESRDQPPSPELMTAVFAYARSIVPSPELPRFNRTADDYEATRDSVLGAPAAHLLAYYGRSRLGLTIL